MFKKLVFVIMVLPTIVVAQHTIKGHFSPAKDYEWVVLYEVTPISSLFIANTEVNDEGYFEFQLDSTITKGMYKLVYALPQEENNFDIIYNAKEDVEFTFNNETGIEYKFSIENQIVSSYTNSMSLISQSIGNFFQQQSTDSLALASIFKTQRETQSNFEEAAKETIASHFIKANKPYIPEDFEDIKTYINNLKIYYFDHVDFNNEILQSSSFLIERILNYVFGMYSENEEEIITYENNIDDVFLAMKDADHLIKKTLLEVLWQQMVDANFEEVANYISDNYLIGLAEALDDRELVEGLTLYKSLSIGNVAPDFSLESKEETTTNHLSNLNTAENYIIVFWSSTCAHCLNEIPQLQAYLNALEKGKLQVIAIGLEDEPFRWRNETLKYPEFIHVLGLGKWKNEIGNSYNVTATPTYYVLDKAKKIIAKPYDFENLKKFLED
ncbi:MAG: TlpA family protein disulfide reductase [Bacteroidetes bacterium]|nr:MAG: TlpA family protein disulfide reductase [Bacteroidota bacterium]